jgi:hypothetical protein
MVEYVNIACNYHFCLVCCDHLLFMLQSSAEKNVVGGLLELNQEQGKKAIADSIDKNVQNNCKDSCKKEYPNASTNMPTPKQPVPRDPDLGNQNKPAMSCMDIKEWGP